MSPRGRTAPPELELPAHAQEWLGLRSTRVLGHGFGPDTVGPQWWAQELGRHALTQTVATRDHAGEQRLTRADLFDLGNRAGLPGASDNEVLTFLWHVLAWGTGSEQRGNRQRIAAFSGPDQRELRIPMLRTAIGHAAEGEVRTAYSTLIRRGGGVIPGLGPAFFTKLLYFVSEGTAGQRCLILDARVAQALHEAGWKSLPHSNAKFSANWYTDTYVSYCELLQRWADEQSATLGMPVSPDEIERNLFEGNGASPA